MRTKLLLAVLLLSTLCAIALSAETPINWEQARETMVKDVIAGAGIKNPRVLDSMRHTPRHEFVPLKGPNGEDLRRQAYYDMALPIGESQTISPPLVVAFMTETLDPQPTDTVLEIGTGSGYQAAVLSPLVKDVYTIEIVEKLGKSAAKVLERLKYKNVHTKIGDGYQGWPENAPFDKIIVTCSPEKIPEKLVEQLKEGGRMVIPVGERYEQVLYLLKKVDGKMEKEALQPTLFVPMTGKAEKERDVKPDPANPKIRNGGFEETIGDPPEPVAWYYVQQMKIVASYSAPEGKQYVTFFNTVAGRMSLALQGGAVDGRKVNYLDVSYHVSGKNVRPMPIPNSKPERKYEPGIVFVFYDENRAPIEEKLVGPVPSGTFDWEKDTRHVTIPPKAREVIIRIGLLGATGELSLDGLEMTAGKK